MKKHIILTILVFATASWFTTSAQESIFQQSFELTDDRKQFIGFYDQIEGISGAAIHFDGYTSFFEQQQFRQELPDAFTINAWVALEAYPWYRCPVFDLRRGEEEGVLLGINRHGRITTALGQPIDWTTLKGPQLAIGQWHMLSLTVEKLGQVKLYLDGQLVQETAAPKIRNTNGNRLTIGRNALLEDWWDFQYIVADHYSFLDGVVDEVQLFEGAFAPDQVANLFKKQLPLPDINFQNRVLPPKAPASVPFGARYTRLDYSKQWDRLWRVGDYPDVVVNFADNDCRLVFWRGTSFVPCWVTENNIWYTNEWTETWGGDVSSCAEPLMDRECRHSHARIIENTPARVVVHWRYALVDADYKVVAQDVDGRGEWCDEYYIIYPDGMGIRKIDLYYSKPLRNHDWEEAIVLLSPGQHPDEVMQDPEITLMNMKGEQHHYSWRNNLPVEMKEPQKANIHVVNFKSEYKPFYIVSDEAFESKEGKYESPFFRSYAAFMADNYRPDTVPSIYGWWNHWPITQLPGDGRWVETNDRASHFNLTTYTQWKDYYMDDRVKSRIMLHGMAKSPDTELIPLAKSWLSPPTVQDDGGLVEYNQAERAYVLKAGKAKKWQLSVTASKEQPFIKHALIITGRELFHPEIKLDGKSLKNGKDFTTGVVRETETPKTVIWFDQHLTKSFTLHIEE